MDSPRANAEYFLFLATTYHFWVQIMILILVGQLLTLQVEFGLGEVWVVSEEALDVPSCPIKDGDMKEGPNALVGHVDCPSVRLGQDQGKAVSVLIMRGSPMQGPPARATEVGNVDIEVFLL